MSTPYRKRLIQRLIRTYFPNLIRTLSNLIRRRFLADAPWAPSSTALPAHQRADKSILIDQLVQQVDQSSGLITDGYTDGYSDGYLDLNFK